MGKENVQMNWRKENREEKMNQDYNDGQHSK